MSYSGFEFEATEQRPDGVSRRVRFRSLSYTPARRTPASDGSLDRRLHDYAHSSRSRDAVSVAYSSSNAPRYRTRITEPSARYEEDRFEDDGELSDSTIRGKDYRSAYGFKSQNGGSSEHRRSNHKDRRMEHRSSNHSDYPGEYGYGHPDDGRSRVSSSRTSRSLRQPSHHDYPDSHRGHHDYDSRHHGSNAHTSSAVGVHSSVASSHRPESRHSVKLIEYPSDGAAYGPASTHSRRGSYSTHGPTPIYAAHRRASDTMSQYTGVTRTTSHRDPERGRHPHYEERLSAGTYIGDPISLPSRPKPRTSDSTVVSSATQTRRRGQQRRMNMPVTPEDSISCAPTVHSSYGRDDHGHRHEHAGRSHVSRRSDRHGSEYGGRSAAPGGSEYYPDRIGSTYRSTRDVTPYDH